MYFNQSTREIKDRILFGKYRMLSLVGRGGMGQVYLIKDINTHRKYAMKVMEDNARSRREKEILKELNGVQGIPAFYEYRVYDGKLYIIMEYIDGLSIKEFMKHQGQPKEKQVILWGKALCRILEVLHKKFKIAYMDLKPANIILHPLGKLYLLDFGISIRFGETMDGCGTRGFAAPEQFHSYEKADEASDIYSLGKILEFCSPKGQKKDMKGLIKKCTKRNPEERYPAIGEVYKELCSISRKRNIKKMTAGSFFAVIFLFLVWGMKNHSEKFSEVSDDSQNKSKDISKIQEQGSWSEKDWERWSKTLQEGKLEILEMFAKMGEEKYFFSETRRCLREKVDGKQAWKLYYRYLVYQEEKGENICQDYEQFIERYPEFSDVYIEYAIYLCRQKQGKKARKIYMQGIKRTKMIGDNAEQLKEKLGL